MSQNTFQVSADNMDGLTFGVETTSGAPIPVDEVVAEETNDHGQDTVNEGTTVNMTAGDRNCYIYFDTEFTGLQRNTTLISIGMVDADGRSFYAEFTDFDLMQVSPWVLQNVIKKLQKPATVLDGDHWTMQGTKKEIALQVMFWLDKYASENRLVQFVSDVCHYDFVLLLDLILGDDKDATQLPAWISSCCVDVNQDLATSIYRTCPPNMTMDEFNKNYVPAMSAFTISRDDLAAGISEFNYDGEQHNSLYDAYVIRAIHQNLWNIEK